MYCMECGAEIETQSKFCGKCGQQVSLVNATAAPQRPPSSPYQVIEQVSAKPVNRKFDINNLSTKNALKATAIFLILCFMGVMVFENLPNALKISGSGSIGSEKSILDEIWANYMKSSGANDSGEGYLELQGHLLKKGSVPPSALNSSVEGRLPSYLACYDYIFVLPGLGDSKQSMCVFYISNPKRGTVGVKWKGRQYLGDLEQMMISNGFVEENK